ncbi:MAG: pyruvate kinase [Desulfosarcina sp.]|nr:pyruvate kinase [Desulfobacterales bacterium]
MPKTRIVCTIGPSSRTEEILRALITAGMNVARLNFSHGSHEDHAEKIKTIRRLSHEMNTPVAILQDLCGPKIRVGDILDPGIRLHPGQAFVLTGETVEGGQDRVSVSYRDLSADVSAGDRLLLADGMMELEVQRTEGAEIYTRVIIGGILTSRKGVNLPTASIQVAALTSKDQDDLLFGLSHDVDYVALSFVRSADDIHAIKSIIAGQGRHTPVIAKVEKHEALDHMDAIVAAADGIMVARGDLGVEIPLENVPSIQKRLIRKANHCGKPVIIATQMLRSMVDSPRPTRAEAADVANGVLDGADGVMLSEETASGSFPVEAVRYMAKIIQAAEEGYPHLKYLQVIPSHDISESVAAAACSLAASLNAAAIVATTRSGMTARHVSRFRPKSRLIALSPSATTVRRLALCWGCRPCYLRIGEDTDEMIENAATSALETGFVKAGDLVVITAGRPLYTSGTTNILWVKRL